MQGMEHWVFIERRTENSDASFEEVPKSQTVQISGQDLSPNREDHMQLPKDREERETEDPHEDKGTDKVVPIVKGAERRIRLTQREQRLVMVPGEWDTVESKARTAPDGAPADDNREWAVKMDTVKQGQVWSRGEAVEGEEPSIKRTKRGTVASGSSERPQDMSRTIVEIGKSRRVILCDEEDVDDSADETEGEWNNEVHWEDQQKTLIWCESSGYQQPEKSENVEESDISASSQHHREQMQSSVLNGRKEERQQDETAMETFREYDTTDILMPDDHTEDGCATSTNNTEEALASRLPNESMSSSVQMTERSTEDLPLEDWGPPVLHFMLPTIIPLPVSLPRERGHQEAAAASNPSERILVQPNPRPHAASYQEGNGSPAESTTDTPGDLSSPDSGCEITLTDAAVTLLNSQQ